MLGPLHPRAGPPSLLPSPPVLSTVLLLLLLSLIPSVSAQREGSLQHGGQRNADGKSHPVFSSSPGAQAASEALPADWIDMSSSELEDRLPTRWKSYLPDFGASAADAKSKEEGEAKTKVQGEGVKVMEEQPPPYPLPKQKGGKDLQPQSRPAKEAAPGAIKGRAELNQAVYPYESYDNDNDNDDEDEDDTEEFRDYLERQEEQRLYLKRKAKSEALRANAKARKASSQLKQGVQQAAHALTPGGSSTTSTTEAQRSLWDGIKTLWSTLTACFNLTWYSVRLGSRYLALCLRLVWGILRFSLAQVGRALLLLWGTARYTIRQVLRPMRVVGAPVVYLFLGVKWAFLDWPGYYLIKSMREVYPLYVFLGAALALGTAIGLSSSFILYLGSLAFSSRSPLESHLATWGKAELNNFDNAMAHAQQGLASWDQADVTGGNGGGKRDGSRRVNGHRSREAHKRTSRVVGRAAGGDSLIEEAMRRRRASMPLDKSSGSDGGGIRYANEEEDRSQGGDQVPDFLRGLGTSWRPIPRSRDLNTGAIASTGDGGSTDFSRDASQDGGGDEDEGGGGESWGSEGGHLGEHAARRGRNQQEPEDYFSVPPPAGRRHSSAGSTGSPTDSAALGQGWPDASPHQAYRYPQNHTVHNQGRFSPASHSAWASTYSYAPIPSPSMTMSQAGRSVGPAPTGSGGGAALAEKSGSARRRRRVTTPTSDAF